MLTHSLAMSSPGAPPRSQSRCSRQGAPAGWLVVRRVQRLGQCHRRQRYFVSRELGVGGRDFDFSRLAWFLQSGSQPYRLDLSQRGGAEVRLPFRLPLQPGESMTCPLLRMPPAFTVSSCGTGAVGCYCSGECLASDVSATNGCVADVDDDGRGAGQC